MSRGNLNTLFFSYHAAWVADLRYGRALRQINNRIREPDGHEHLVVLDDALGWIRLPAQLGGDRAGGQRGAGAGAGGPVVTETSDGGGVERDRPR